MIIEVKDISKKIADHTVLDHISLRLESGNIYGLKGKNGSGKTMLMRAICGLIKVTRGEVWINDELLRKDISFPRSVGILIEGPGFIRKYSGFKNLKLLVSIKKLVSGQEISQAMRTVGLDPQDKRNYRKYSMGMKQKLGIAAAIVEDPELIILDEPTNGLDEKSIENLRKMLNALRDRGKLIIISCHDTEELEGLSDEIIEIKNGGILNMGVYKNEKIKKK